MADKPSLFRYVANPTRPAPRESFGSFRGWEKSPGPRSLYQPILPTSREIRLVILHPSSDSRAIIKCTLVRACLNSIPAAGFEALSYEWGNPGAEETIIINDIAKRVRRNLWDALRHLRGLEDRIIWIDAICIDQENISERNHQVRQMAQIYSTAWRVLIWLGAEEDDSRTAIKFISQIGRLRSEDSGFRLGTSSYQPYEIRAVQNLLHRPYWTRLWIIQEVIVAREALILCGADGVSWNHFSMFHAVLESLQTPYKYFHKTLAFKLNLHQKVYGSGDVTLQNLIQDFARSECSDIRDKIFGLAGLANDAHNLLIDYSLSVFDLFENVIMLYKDKEPRSLVAFAQKLQDIMQGYVKDSAERSSRSRSQLCKALGFEAGWIKDIGPYYEDAKDHTNHQEAFDSPLRSNNYSTDSDLFSSKKISKLLHNESQSSIFQSAISIISPKSYGEPADIPDYHRPLQRSMSMDADYTQPPDQLTSFRPNEQHLNSETNNHYDARYVEPQLFIDEMGNVGIGPSNIRRSDTLCRFQGCDIITILRKIGNRYYFVGRALSSSRRSVNHKPITMHMDTYTLQRLTQ